MAETAGHQGFSRIRLPDANLRSVLLSLATLALVLFHDAILRGRVFFQRDIHSVWYEQVESFVRAIAAGSWPLWDPFVGFGQPMLANPNSQVLYPFTWLHLILAPGTQYTVYLVAHFLLAGWGMYRLARSLELTHGASLVACCLWTTSGPYLSLGNVWHHLAGASWMPWVLLLVQRALESGCAGGVLRCAAAVAAQFLAGSPDMSLLTGLVALALGLRRLHWRSPRHPFNVRALTTGAGVLLFALGLAAAQWLPTLEIARRSERWNLAPDARAYWSVHPLKLAQTLVPVQADELPLRDATRALLYESRGPFLPSLYLGAAALVLVAAALSAPRRRQRGFLVALGATAALVALGRHTPLYQAATMLVPPLRMVRYPEKVMIVVALAWALLGGIGFECWRSGSLRERRRRLALLVCGALVLCLWTLGAAMLFGAESLGPRLLTAEELSWHTYTDTLAPHGRRLLVAASAATFAWLAAARSAAHPRAAPLVAACAAIADLCLFHAHLNPTASPELLRYRPPLAELLRQADTSRVYVYEYATVEGRSRRYLGRDSPYLYQGVPQSWPSDQVATLTARSSLVPPAAGALGLYGSYDVDLLGLYPRPLTELVLFLRSVEGTPLQLRLLRMGAVSHVVALHTAGFENLLPVANLESYYPERIHVFRVPDALPRSHVVGGSRIADGRGALQVLADPGFDLAREVLLADGIARPAPVDFKATSRLLELRPDRVRIATESNASGFVVLADAYDPGWLARVDGEPVITLRANVAFRAVPVPAGEHVVELVYRPPGVLAGLAVSAATLLAGLLLVHLSRRRSHAPAAVAAL